MVRNSPRSSSNSTVPNKALTVKGTGQLRLNQRVTRLRKTSLTATKTPRVRGRVNATENVKANEIRRGPSRILRNVGEPNNHVENISGNENDSTYDGRMHSYPYKKNGPYTCPKCRHVCATSQLFAAHVSSSHYKYETKAEKKKRLMAKVRGRNLRLQVMNDGLITVVPASTPLTAAENNRNNVRGRNVGPVMVKVEVKGEHGVEVALALAPPPGMKLLPGTVAVAGAGNGDGGVKIKSEPVV